MTYQPAKGQFLERDSVHHPARATIYSAIIPGLGQVYNEKYWKVGVIYAGGFTLGYFFKQNTDSMRAYQRAVDARFDTLSGTVDFRYAWMSDAKVLQERNYYRRNRDMLILGILGAYALQIIDANVDAHLREFEINRDLALKLEPDVHYSAVQNSWNVGLGLTLQIR